MRCEIGGRKGEKSSSRRDSRRRKKFIELKNLCQIAFQDHVTFKLLLPPFPNLHLVGEKKSTTSQSTPHLTHLPPCLHRNHLRRPFPNPQHRQHRIRRRHLREHARIRNPHALQAPQPQAGIHNRHRIPLHIPHFRRARRVVHRMRDPPPVLAQLFIRREGRARGDFALEPRAEGLCGGDLARGAQARDDGAGVVAVRVGEVFEVQGGLDGWVGAGEVELAL